MKMMTRLVLITGLAVAVAPLRADSGAIDRAEIRSRLKQTWDAVETLEAIGEEFPCDSARARRTDSKAAFQKFDFRMASAGRRTLKLVTVPPSGHPRNVIWFHEDGRKIYLMQPFDDDGNSISTMLIKAQTDTQERLRTTLLSFLWMWTPRGEPLYRYLDKNTGLEFLKDEQGKSIIVINSESDGLALRFELDPTHDYLPRKIVIGKNWEERYTTRFERINGLWFPFAGFETIFKDGKPFRQSGFEVKELHVNRALSESTFGPPKIEEGVLVSDYSGDRKGGIRGGLNARERLVAKHFPSGPPSPVSPVNSVPRVPEGISWSLVVAISSSCALIAAIALRILKNR